MSRKSPNRSELTILMSHHRRDNDPPPGKKMPELRQQWEDQKHRLLTSDKYEGYQKRLEAFRKKNINNVFAYNQKTHINGCIRTHICCVYVNMLTQITKELIMFSLRQPPTTGERTNG